jgi:hypothetical protein
MLHDQSIMDTITVQHRLTLLLGIGFDRIVVLKLFTLLNIAGIL